MGSTLLETIQQTTDDDVDMECFENSTESRGELQDESGFEELNTVHSASFRETGAAVDAAVRAAVCTADADEGSGSAVVALEGMDPTAATITVVSSLLGRRNPDRTGVGRSSAFIGCLDAIENQLQMQQSEVKIFDEGFMEFYKLYQDLVIRFEGLATSDPVNNSASTRATNTETTDVSSSTSATVSTTTTTKTTSITTSHLHESLMAQRSALEREHVRLLRKSEMVFAAIAGIDGVLGVRDSSVYDHESRMRDLLREMLLTECLSFMSEYVRIRRALRR